MGMFILGLAVGCTGCALIATVMFSLLGLSIVGKGKKHKKAESPKSKQ